MCESIFNIQIMPQDVFYDSELPSLIKIPQVIGIALVAFVLAILATFYPASRASKIQPAESLRYD